MLHDNVFPVTAQRKPWLLDRARKNPRLRITRLQFPLAPGFAITAHVAQGQTLREGVIADFNISSVASAFTTYVAATRVTGRDKLLILWPFPLGLFQNGSSVGRDMLLRVWRGDRIDWEALRAKYLEERACGECKENKPKAAFTAGQWKRTDASRVCRECVGRHRDAGEPYQCNVCRFWFSDEAFPTKHRRNESSCYRVCSACETQKPCHRCNVKKPVAEFTASAWKARHADRRICKACMKKGHWTCATCHLSLAHIDFSAWLRRRPSGPNGTQECNHCIQSLAARRAAVRARGWLEARRRRIRQRAILEQVRAEIASAVLTRNSCQGTKQRKRPRPQNGNDASDSPTRARRGETTRVVPNPPQNDAREDSFEVCGNPGVPQAPTWKEYKCPFCQATIQSTVQNGSVKTTGHQTFRARNGLVVRGNRHSCPKCGAEVQSACARGQIRSKHKMSNGKACPTTRWYVK